jgi:hypothetical protein
LNAQSREVTIVWENDMKNEATARQTIFYRVMALSFIVLSFVAFSTGFIRLDLGARFREPWVQIHAVTFIAWQFMFLWQTMLIAASRTTLHRRFGIALAMLAVVMMGGAIQAGLAAFAKNGHPVGVLSLLYVALPHVDMILFTGFVCLALAFRKKPDIHKRLMLLAAIALMDAVTGRLPVLWRIGPWARYVVQDAFVVAAIAYDWIYFRRVHPAYVWGGLAILVSPPLAEPAWLLVKSWL